MMDYAKKLVAILILVGSMGILPTQSYTASPQVYTDQCTNDASAQCAADQVALLHAELRAARENRGQERRKYTIKGVLGVIVASVVGLIVGAMIIGAVMYMTTAMMFFCIMMR